MNALRVGMLNIGIIRYIFYYFAAKRNFCRCRINFAILPSANSEIGKSTKFRSSFHETCDNFGERG